MLSRVFLSKTCYYSTTLFAFLVEVGSWCLKNTEDNHLGLSLKSETF